MLKAIIVGMQRSGTSILARVLHKSGVNMGEPFLPADIVNPDGYYESQRFLDLCKTVLRIPEVGDLSPDLFIHQTDPIHFYRACHDFIRSTDAEGLKCPLMVPSWHVWGAFAPREPLYIIVRRERISQLESLRRLRDLRKRQGRPVPDNRDLMLYHDMSAARLDQIQATVREAMPVAFHQLVDPMGQRHLSGLLAPQLALDELDWSSVRSSQEVENERAAGRWL